MTNAKLEILMQKLTGLGQVAVAFSGGVDSTFLAAAAHQALQDKAVAVTACSETMTPAEKEASGALARKIGIRQVFLPSGELSSPDFTANTPQRCYFCKKERFTAIRQWADSQSIAWIAEGSNADDPQDYRPGMKALQEVPGVFSPLWDAGLTKQDIRELSQKWRLPTFNKPSESCLATRLAYGLPITGERLTQVARGEAFLREFCGGPIRVRHHGNLARIEVSPAVVASIAAGERAAEINAFFQSLGFLYITVDLAGYRQGSMNKELANER